MPSHQAISYDPAPIMGRKMKWLIRILLLGSCSSVFLAAQVVDVTVCDILANPQSFDGKTVRVKGIVSAGFDEFVLKDAACNQPVNAIWLAYPQGTKGKAGAAAFVQLQLARNNPATTMQANRPPVKIEKNKEFKQFDSLLSTRYKSGGMCLGCTRYTVTATLVGRLDGVKEAGLGRNSTGKFVNAGGFGNLNLYRARLVLQSVADVSPKEIDYSRVSSATKDDSERESASGDPVAAAHDAARAFGAESQAGKEVERAAAAFGKEGEDNGVQVGFGIPNEIPDDDGLKAGKDSPDGILFNCIFDTDRLKGDALARAIAHVGTHIADLRDPGSLPPAYNLEHRAWQTTVLGAVAFRQKTLTAPGGYLLWNSGWPAAERNKLMEDGITGFLTDWAVLKKDTGPQP